MKVTARAINRATLARQLLLRREPLSVADAMHRVMALQAQHAASPYLAMWNRIIDLDPADVDAAFADYTVVKGTLMRMTLHAVHTDDYAAFRDAIEPTMYATHLNGRFTPAGLTLDAGRALVRDLLEFADQPRTGEELKAWLEPRCGAVSPTGVWAILRSYTPMQRVPTGGPWSFTSRSTYIAARTRPVLDLEASAKALEALVLRYLAAFGPATVADIAQFALVQQARVKAALREMDGAVERMEGPDGKAVFDLPGAPRPAEDTAAPPRLMAMWDNTLLAHVDRNRLIPPEYRRLVIRSNGDVLPTLLVDGYVAGVWRPAEGGIEAAAFHDLPGEVWEEFAAEAGALVALLADREPHPYRRYDSWWSKLPGVETRLLAG
ncbi:winged helix DNA-binding domain-containing protein [Nonomuraea basaltis]|uniref:winged helix DNA-binding domain-containing protein n=1 Tax=Nonomuraea basaltis TaxID=2495887 RepID=UPI00110C546B|nr:winged helix DNA-binding domain-containing protein [Nonomuraea basaltis]TMR99658.1 winged helix DNA-binding domain-containing protein [Nonomuraea basaltis]